MKHLIACALCIILSGCSFFRDMSKESCEEITLNTQAVRDLSICVLDSWLVNSGLFRAAMGDGIKDLPAHAVEALDGLDLLAFKYATDPESITDFEKGQVIGYKIRILHAAIIKIIETYAPEALRYLPR